MNTEKSEERREMREGKGQMRIREMAKWQDSKMARRWNDTTARLIVPCAGVLFVLACCFSVQALAQAPDRSKPPALGPPPVLKLPPIQHFKLSNGLPVLLMERHEVPLVQINLLVNAGTADDPPGKPGLASMTAAMLTEGAGPRGSLELADAIDFLGARLSAVAGMHSFVITLHTPLTHLDSSLVLLSDVALHPTFPPAELERQRKERLTALMQWRDEPRALASVEFNHALYGSNHPYGIPSLGTEQALRSFTRSDLEGFRTKYFGPNNSTLVVVGDVTPASLLPRLESAFGGWKQASPENINLQPIEQVSERRIFLVDKPGAAQSEIRIGRIGVPRLTEDYFAITVMNTILGGSFTSRLNRNLREEHGYTYGAGSRFEFRRLAGPFMSAAAVQTAVTDSALVEFMKELNSILQPVTDAELQRAKNYEALGFPADFQSVAQVAGELEQLPMYGLPDDYFNRYIDRIEAVTKEDVQRVAKKYIDPGKVDIIIVGDRKKIEAGVRALKLGPVTLLTIGDVLGKEPVLDTKND